MVDVNAWHDKAEETEDVFGSNPIVPQGQNGVPHFSYYDQDRALLFIWNGQNYEHVTVAFGDGEPVKWTFEFQEFWKKAWEARPIKIEERPIFISSHAMSVAPYAFEQACKAWIKWFEVTAFSEEKEDPTSSSEFKICFDECNVNWTNNVMFNQLFLKGVQNHMNHILQTRGHVFLNDVLDCLGAQRVPHGAVSGWLSNEKETTGDGYIDFLPQDMLSRGEPSVWLKFNVDGVIYENI